MPEETKKIKVALVISDCLVIADTKTGERKLNQNLIDHLISQGYGQIILLNQGSLCSTLTTLGHNCEQTSDPSDQQLQQLLLQLPPYTAAQLQAQLNPEPQQAIKTRICPSKSPYGAQNPYDYSPALFRFQQSMQSKLTDKATRAQTLEDCKRINALSEILKQAQQLMAQIRKDPHDKRFETLLQEVAGIEIQENEELAELRNKHSYHTHRALKILYDKTIEKCAFKILYDQNKEAIKQAITALLKYDAVIKEFKRSLSQEEAEALQSLLSKPFESLSDKQQQEIFFLIYKTITAISKINFQSYAGLTESTIAAVTEQHPSEKVDLTVYTNNPESVASENTKNKRALTVVGNGSTVEQLELAFLIGQLEELTAKLASWKNDSNPGVTYARPDYFVKEIDPKVLALQRAIKLGNKHLIALRHEELKTTLENQASGNNKNKLRQEPQKRQTAFCALKRLVEDTAQKFTSIGDPAPIDKLFVKLENWAVESSVPGELRPHAFKKIDMLVKALFDAMQSKNDADTKKYANELKAAIEQIKLCSISRRGKALAQLKNAVSEYATSPDFPKDKPTAPSQTSSQPTGPSTAASPSITPPPSPPLSPRPQAKPIDSKAGSGFLSSISSMFSCRAPFFYLNKASQKQQSVPISPSKAA